MAHFAELGEDNVVLRVIIVANEELFDENNQESEAKGVEFCRNLLGGIWKQTSYNGNFRGRYAGTGYTYNSALDAYIAPKPFPSWTLDEETTEWEPPVAPPTEGAHSWNEDAQTWDAFEMPE
jgi:hypothetical protein